MAYLKLSPLILTPNWNWGGTSVTLRVFASESFYELTTGEFVAQGRPSDINSFCQEIACVVSGTTVTIPEITLATTTDSSTPNATYTIILYDSSNVPRYTMASQWYVDPDFFQVLPQSSVQVAAAGSTLSNGVYTYRGLSANKPYYNPTDSTTSTTLSVIIYNGTNWVIKNSSGTTLYTGSATSDYPWTGTWGVTSGVSPAPSVSEDTAVVASTWENFTISNQGSMPWPQPWNAYWTIPQTQQYIASIVGTGTTPYATKLIAGKTELSEYPAVAARPIALGVNDTVWQGINKSIYLDSYANTSVGLAAAIAAIGSTVTQLVITQSCTITGSVTIPSNIIVTFEGQGGFNVSSGTVTISAMAPTAAYQVFSGAGDVVFAKNATGGQFHLEWWAGISNASTIDHAFAQVTTSLENGDGGILNIGTGTWKVTDWLIPNNTTIQGSGGAGETNGTIVMIGSTTAGNHAPFIANEGFRNITINNLTLSASTGTGVSCFIAQGTTPTSAFGLYFNNVTFEGTGVAASRAASVGQVRFRSVSHDWEVIGVEFNQCIWRTPENGKSVHWDTVNSDVLFVKRQANNAKNSIFFYGDYSPIGIIDILPDNRGVAGLTPIATFNRNITCTCTISSKNVTVTSGTVSLNDVGQKIILDNGGDSVTTAITGITSATTFTVADNWPGSTATGVNGQVSYYSPDTNGAYAVWQFVNSRGTVDINTTVDEGYQYFLINDGSDNLSPVNINGGIIQSLIQLNEAMVLNVNGCRMTSQLFNDASGKLATIGMSVSNSISSTTWAGVTLLAPTIWGQHLGTSIVTNNFNYGYIGGSFSPIYKQVIGTQTQFLQGVKNPGNLTTPLAFFGAADVTPSPTANKRLFSWGRLEATSDIPDYYYWVERDYDTGFTLFVGNQPVPYRGYDFDANLYATCFTGDVTTDTTGATEANYDPGTASMFFRLDPTVATTNISGLGLTASSLSTAMSGEIHQIWNVDAGSNTIVLQNQNAGSSAANRFLCDTGADITLLPNEGAALWYDGTTARWRVSKLNITGLTSNGTTVTSSLPMTVTGALTASSTVAVTTSIAVGGGTALTTTTASGSGFLVKATSPTISTATLSGTTAAGNIASTGGITSSSPSVGIGYATGAGGAVTQLTNRTTGVTMVPNPCISGLITTNNASLAAEAAAEFTVTNNAVAVGDVVSVSIRSGTNGGNTEVYVSTVASGSFKLKVANNNAAGGTAETGAILINFCIIKAVSS